MDQLPKESLLRIISYLAISEKLNLAATCKRLKHLVMNSDLYKNLVLRGDRSFYDFKEYFENYKEYQRQVRNLQLRFMFIEPSVVLALPKQFVNLREIGWISEDSFEEVAVNEQAAQHWKNITRFKEHSPSFISAGILEQDGFCNLIELDVEICDNCDSLICQLSKAPKLKILRLKHFEITLLALDQLQCNAQQLEVLNLRNFRVSRWERDSASGGKIQLKELVIENYIGGRNQELLAYLAYKYEHLEALEIDIHIQEPDWDEADACLVNFISASPDLETYNVSTHPITAAVLEAMDENGIELKTLTITTVDVSNGITHVLGSKQREFVEIVTIRCWEPLDNANGKQMELFTLLQGFPNLKHLGLQNEDDFPINKFLQIFRHLESISLSKWRIMLASDIVDDFTTNLKSLTLENVRISNENREVMRFVSKTCPKLSKLTITHVDVLDEGEYDEEDIQTDEGDITLEIDCPDHSFVSIIVNTPSFIDRHYYKMTTENGTRWYKVDKGYLEETLTDPPTLGERPVVSLQYKHCDSLIIIDTRIPGF